MHSLRLTAIKIKNFKSFEGVHEISGLDHSLTVIVGPNGSGKSNIIDAVLFVLGFRAKKMRHAVQTDIIYKDVERRNMCSVELVFDKGGTTFTVRRELYISKKNRYFLNNQEVRSTDIQGFLSNEGLDLENNRFLILQGEIESISMMKPKAQNEKAGLLEYLEEVIGTSQLRTSIEEKRRELERLRDEGESRAAVFGFYEKEFKYVEDRKKENDRSMRDTLRYLEAKRRVCELNMEKMRRSIECNAQKVKEMRARAAELGERSLSNRAVLETLERDVASSRSELCRLESVLLEARRVFSVVDVEQRSYERRKRRCEERIGALAAEIDQLKAREAALSGEQELCRGEMQENAAMIESLVHQLQNMQANARDIESKHESRVAEHKKTVLSLEKDLQGVFKEREEVYGQEVALRLEIEKREKAMLEAKQEADRLQEELARLDMHESEDTVSLRIRDAQREYDVLVGDIDATWKQVNKRRFLLREARRREEQNSGAKKVDDAIKGIRGVYGRLCELGTVDEKYEHAIAAASKGALNHVVVDRTETAEKCAGVIKSNGLIRTTFIILERICDVPCLKKEAAPYAYSLVKTDSRFVKCFYYALKDTLVVETLTEGRELAFGRTRKRVVTLDGNLIEKSGLMSSTSKGCIGISKAKKYESEVSKLEEVLKEMHARREALCKRKHELEETAKLLSNREARRAEICRGLENANAKSQLCSVNEKDQARLQNLKKKRMGFEDRISSIKNEICRRNNLILDTYGARYKKLVSEKSTLEEKLVFLEKRAQDLRLKLSDITFEGFGDRAEELRRLQEELVSLKPASGYEEARENVSSANTAYKERLCSFKVLNEKLNEIKNTMDEDYYMENELRSKMEDINSMEMRTASKMTSLKSEVEVLSEEIRSICSYFGITETEESYHNTPDKELEALIAKEEEDMRKIKARSFDTEMLREYNAKKSEFEEAKKEYNVFLKSLGKVSNDLRELSEERHALFMKGFNIISKSLKEVYQTITFGGNAELELVDCLDPFSEGVAMSVMPPRKSWKNIANLSGGEKTLASLALLFALHMYKPSPVYFMDEVDAALDFRNVSVVANFIKEKAREVQFIVISLRSDMFELSNTLLGVYKNNDSSKFILVNTNQLVS